MDEIHKAISTEKDLPNVERDQLLRSLNLPGYAHEPFGAEMLPGGTMWSPELPVFEF